MSLKNNIEVAAIMAAKDDNGGRAVIDIRNDYLASFHRTCNTVAARDDDEHHTLPAKLQRVNIGSNKDSMSTPRDISDVPIEALKHVASYLPNPSRALLAVALNKKLARREYRAIAGNQWTTLDFGGIEKTLAEKLTDDDISAVLLCIDSVRTVRRLRLANCINITGVGLEPLRGSRVIKHIDLSLVPDHTSPNLDPEPPLSQEIVLPILTTVMGGRLKVIEFPKVWRFNEAEFQLSQNGGQNAYNQFLEMFVLNMNFGRGFRCEECQEEIPPNFSTEALGTQCFICYKCHNSYCGECDYDELIFCEKCERHYCGACMDHIACGSCNTMYCSECETLTYCHDCGEVICSDCTIVDPCKQCDKMLQTCSCGACYDDKTGEFTSDEKKGCSYCPNSFCDDCISIGYLSTCDKCMKGHCGRCVQREGLHRCMDHEFCEDLFFNSWRLCRTCRVGSSGCSGLGFNCKACYVKHCPKLLTKHEVVLRENDILRKEIATLAMKLQEAEEGVKAMDVDMVMSQVGCTRTRAVKALKDHDKDVIEAIMSLV